jgi:hypothetical protein
MTVTDAPVYVYTLELAAPPPSWELFMQEKKKKKKESKPSRRAHKRNLNKKSTLLKVKFMYQNRMPE